jgi:VIT1/CCC1 family predicted Fe2+/Mn2+ transporter
VTTTISAVSAGREEIRTLLVGAISCNIAWGLVYAAMFLMSALIDRGRALRAIRSVRSAAQPADAHRIITREVAPILTDVLTTDELERVRQALLRVPDLPPSLDKKEWLSALAVFLLVVLSTFPVVIPFLVFRNVHVAVRLSNLVAIAMLFAAGYLVARHAGLHPWRTGLNMVVLGALLLAITIALGG